MMHDNQHFIKHDIHLIYPFFVFKIIFEIVSLMGPQVPTCMKRFIALEQDWSSLSSPTLPLQLRVKLGDSENGVIPLAVDDGL